MAEKTQNKNNRERIIVKTSIVRIIVNICLSGFKAFIGFVSNSIAITLDAVNNLSDALFSAVIKAAPGSSTKKRSASIYTTPYREQS